MLLSVVAFKPRLENTVGEDEVTLFYQILMGNLLQAVSPFRSHICEEKYHLTCLRGLTASKLPYIWLFREQENGGIREGKHGEALEQTEDLSVTGMGVWWPGSLHRAQHQFCSFWSGVFGVSAAKGCFPCHGGSVFCRDALAESVSVNARRNLYATLKCIAFHNQV